MKKEDRQTLEPQTKVSKYTIISLLGQGGFGDVYQVKDENGKKFAMKTENINAPKKALEREIEIISSLKPGSFPKVYDSGQYQDFEYFVMDQYGPSVSQIRKNHFGSLISRHVYLIAYEMLKIIQSLHEQGYVHCDIKPSNFLINNSQEHPLILIDFGITKPYIDFNTHELLEPKDGHFSGTRKYASINALSEKDVGRCDDLICWFYSVVELSHKLPWRNLHGNNEILEAKINCPIEQLTNKLSANFRKIFEYISSLQFKDEPNYERIFSLINNDMFMFSFNRNNFSWEYFYKTETEEMNKNQETQENLEPEIVSVEEEENNEKTESENTNKGKGGCCGIY
ncbi:CK1 family protein kinase [Histomonas meleagridis]|uniref:CK1 family protein kinase n=1 Tax=Histomonas meleagridis TaxID=135588 RepID=UPI00355AB27C|nr:CK1 family protein kinase [Histomonas meleagridis]KAH0804592.1 CK1 family protein kinase [Histomonas meleagridis]